MTGQNCEPRLLSIGTPQFTIGSAHVGKNPTGQVAGNLQKNQINTDTSFLFPPYILKGLAPKE
jgi:hypothetical protein